MNTPAPGALRRLIIATALLVLLAVMAAGPFNTGEQVREAREAAAAERAASARELAEQSAQLDYLAELLAEQRRLLETRPASPELEDVTTRIAVAIEALRTASPPQAATPAPTAAPTAAPTPRPSPAAVQRPPAATPRPTPVVTPRACTVRVLPVCVERNIP